MLTRYKQFRGIERVFPSNIGTDEIVVVVYRKLDLSREINSLYSDNLSLSSICYILVYNLLSLTILKDQSKNVKMQETVNMFINGT